MNTNHLSRFVGDVEVQRDEGEGCNAARSGGGVAQPVLRTGLSRPAAWVEMEVA